MKITLIVEGQTEKAFLSKLRNHLQTLIPGSMPSLQAMPYHGRIPRGDKLRKRVHLLLNDGRSPADHVIALTDVYPDYSNAQDAKAQMSQWVGNQGRFHPHAAQFEFEAWLLPYWLRIQQLAGHNQTAPASNPESVNHLNRPSQRIKEVYRRGQGRYDYVKARDAERILRNEDLQVSIERCSELKALVNSILRVCGSPEVS